MCGHRRETLHLLGIKRKQKEEEEEESRGRSEEKLGSSFFLI